MSILNSVATRAVWLASASTVMSRILRLETAINAALIDQPTSQQAILLMIADQQLGVATRALLAAADTIKRLP